MLKQTCNKRPYIKRRTSSILGAFILCLSSINTYAETSKKSEAGNNELTSTNLASILSDQPDEVKSRYPFRNPLQTLEFFQIKPGMKVVEVLPGGGWYSKILLPLLGPKGELVGADYPFKSWSHFPFMTPERIEKKKIWVETWTEKANTWKGPNSASISAFQLDQMPKSVKGSADAVLFIRALHNLAGLRKKGAFFDAALKDAYQVLKPGGLVGIVQHQAREDRPNSWADGRNGYLKKSFIIERMGAHGFELVAQSNINENPRDQANDGDKVWRLPPRLNIKDDNPAVKQRLIETGESHRMTLLFKKPEAK